MSNKNYPTKQFTVCTIQDSNNLNTNCNTYTATLYKDYTIIINNKRYTNKQFHELYTINIP